MFWKKKPTDEVVEEVAAKKPETPSVKTSEDIEKLLDSKLNNARNTPLNILPCEHFQYEIKKHCGRIARFNRIFMSDDQNPPDCEQLNELLYACRKYVSDPERNPDCLHQLKTYENNLIRQRIDSIKANDVWELRKEPPSDWNSSLPDWAAERIKSSFWFRSKKESNI